MTRGTGTGTVHVETFITDTLIERVQSCIYLASSAVVHITSSGAGETGVMAWSDSITNAVQRIHSKT